MDVIGFYQRHLAYEYWSPSLQRMAYSHLSLSDLGILVFIFLVYAAIFNLGFFILWVTFDTIRRMGIMGETNYRLTVKCLKALMVMGSVAALHFTNNVWVDISN